MNILPKKRWHVRTKENIARVRKDEAEAAEKEKQERLRIENADREARLNLLKEKSKQKLEEAGIYTDIELPHTSTSTEHINLFADLDHAVKTSNKEHDKEVKDKKEEYEKKIGYLTYLGQDTNESLRKKNWYDVPPEATRFTRSNDVKDTYDKLVLKDGDGKPKAKDSDVKNGEVAWRSKQRLDPLNAFKKFCPEKITVPVKPEAKKPLEDYKRLIDSHHHKHKNKKHKKDKKNKRRKEKEEKEKKLQEKKKKLQKLREARLKREMKEKKRTEELLRGPTEPDKMAEENNTCKIKPKYNSQFNPELARQNYRST